MVDDRVAMVVVNLCLDRRGESEKITRNASGDGGVISKNDITTAGEFDN